MFLLTYFRHSAFYYQYILTYYLSEPCYCYHIVLLFSVIIQSFLNCLFISTRRIRTCQGVNLQNRLIVLFILGFKKIRSDYHSLWDISTSNFVIYSISLYCLLHCIDLQHLLQMSKTIVQFEREHSTVTLTDTDEYRRKFLDDRWVCTEY